MQFAPKKRYQPTLDLTPLIDVVFLLLVFLLLTMNFITQKSEQKTAIIDIELARSTTAENAEKPATIEIYLDKEGRYYLDSKTPLSKEELTTLLKERHALAPTAIVNLAGDREASHGQVIEAIDAIKNQGFKTVNMVLINAN